MELKTISKSIVPETILDNMICKKCFKYLTIFPISLDQDGGLICGRCLDGEMARKDCCVECESMDCIEKNFPFEIFGYLNHYFPCVNRFDGCDKLKKLNDIRTHETKCKTANKTLQCFYCNYTGCAIQYVNHFKKVHSKFFLEQPMFTTRLENVQKLFLWIIKDHLISIIVDIDGPLQSIRIDLKSHKFDLNREVQFEFNFVNDKGQVFNTIKIEKAVYNEGYFSISPNKNLFDLSSYLRCQFRMKDNFFQRYYEGISEIN